MQIYLVRHDLNFYTQYILIIWYAILQWILEFTCLSQIEKVFSYSVYKDVFDDNAICNFPKKSSTRQ